MNKEEYEKILFTLRERYFNKGEIDKITFESLKEQLDEEFGIIKSDEDEGFFEQSDECATSSGISERYKFIRQISKGKVSIVFLAKSVISNDYVVIRRIFSDNKMKQDSINRLREDAKLRLGLDHPNIAKFIDYDENTLAIVQEYIKGTDLKEYIKKTRRLPLRKTFAIFRELLDALNYSHQHGVIHRNIKPSNIMIDTKGHVKVLDFGICRIMEEEMKIQSNARRAGYMSPEQIRGERVIDHRSDIYSCGAVMYEMLAGHLPFNRRGPGSNADHIYKNNDINEESLPVTFHIKKFDEGLTDIVLKALEKKPENRYAGCAEFRNALDKYERDNFVPLDLSLINQSYLRRFKIILLCFCIMVVMPFLLIGVNEYKDVLSWRQAEIQDSIEGYETYIEDHEKGRHSERAIEIIRKYKDEDRCWSNVKKTDTFEDLESYIRKYPDGRYIIEAEKRINDKDKQAWDNARRLDTPVDYRIYIQSYKRGRYRDLAQKYIDDYEKELETWTSAQMKDDIVAYRSYLKEYENGRFRQNAQKRIEEFYIDDAGMWEMALEADNIENYRDYIDYSASGVHKEQAEDAIDRIEKDDEAWEETRSRDSIEGYKSYLDSGLTRYRKEAENRISQLKNEENVWQKTLKSDKISDYRSYVSLYPKGSHKDNAETRIRELDDYNYWKKAEKTNTIQALNDYLAKYAKGKYRKEADERIKYLLEEDKLWEKSKQEGTIQSYTRYIDKYKDGRYIELAKKEKKLLTEEDLVWQKAVQSDTASSYRSYLEKYKNGRYSKTAADNIKKYEKEDSDWTSARYANTVESYQNYLKIYKEGRYSHLAEHKMAEFAKIGQKEIFSIAKVDFIVRYCPSGLLWVGRKPVTISRGFWMMETEVTQDLYQAVMGNNPSNFKKGSNPVESVSWYDAVEFCKRLNDITGKKWELPTEVEWEYACRAGTKTKYHFGDSIHSDIANFRGDYLSVGASRANKGVDRKEPIPVASFRPNSWGLYDMHGNVAEWCRDGYTDKYPPDSEPDPVGPTDAKFHVIRGGSWFYDAKELESGFRAYRGPKSSRNDLGFRVMYR